LVTESVDFIMAMVLPSKSTAASMAESSSGTDVVLDGALFDVRVMDESSFQGNAVALSHHTCYQCGLLYCQLTGGSQ
jgi:hypothetical protein